MHSDPSKQVLLPAVLAILTLLSGKRLTGVVAQIGAQLGIFITVWMVTAASTSAVLSAFAFALKVLAVELAFVFLAITAYRLSPFHPLSKYPGPVICKITNFYLIYATATGRRHDFIRAMHETYGDWVRTGPSSLSVNKPQALNPVYRDTKAFNKDGHYRLGQKAGKGIFFIEDVEEHTQRRKYWVPVFSSKMAPRWNEVIQKRTGELIECISSRAATQGELNLTQAIQHWTHDVMGSITFGKSNQFELMAQGDETGTISKVQQGTILYDTFGEIPWLFDLLDFVGFKNDLNEAIVRSISILRERQNDGGEDTSDIMSHLLGRHSKTLPSLSEADLEVESFFSIVAGTDATAGSLTETFFHILTKPQVALRLRSELSKVILNTTDAVDLDKLSTIPYLDAVINESLRTSSVFPAMARGTPPNGAVIEGEYIPGGVSISVPSVMRHFSEENFSPRPEEYLPERWLPDGLGPETVCNGNALMTFGAGPFACLGKAQAYNQMRVVITNLVLGFDMKLVDSFDPKTFRDKSWKMRAMYYGHPLIVTATRRSEFV